MRYYLPLLAHLRSLYMPTAHPFSDQHRNYQQMVLLIGGAAFLPVGQGQPPQLKKWGGAGNGTQPRSFFGGRERCQSPVMQRSFALADIVSTEAHMDFWFAHIDEKMEHWLDANPDSMSKSLKRLPHDKWLALRPPEGPKCIEKLTYFGNIHDTQKPVCNVGGKLFHTSSCDLLSIGSNNQWDTEVGMHDQTRCRIHTFDCTSRDSMPSRIRDRTTFHKICIGDKDFTDSNGLQYLSWEHVLKVAGITEAPAYLKMDIEGFEYTVMRDIIRSGHLMPEQIAMEIHWKTNVPVTWRGRSKSIGEVGSFLTMLFQAGYRLTYVDNATVCSHCMEVLLSRVYC